MTSAIKPFDIDTAIHSVQYHHFPGTTVITCCVKMWNGYFVTGVSYSENIDKFDLASGELYALAKAREKVAAYLAFQRRCGL